MIRTIETETIIEKFLTNDSFVVITNPNHKIWYCEKITEDEFIKFCDDLKTKRLVTLFLKEGKK